MAATPHLIGAIADFLASNAPLAAALTGGISDGQAGRDDPMPYLVIEAKDSHSERFFGGCEIYTVVVWFSVSGTGRTSVEDLANQVRDLILPVDDIAAWSPLGIAGGWRDTNRQPAGGDSIEIDPEIRAAYGRDVWCCKRPITWTLARG